MEYDTQPPQSDSHQLVVKEMGEHGTIPSCRWSNEGIVPGFQPVGISRRLVRQALEPAWEAKLSPHTYGFRPGRSCHEALGALFTAIRFRPHHALKLDMAKCFERIDHPALLAKVQAPPRIRRQLQAWR